MEIRIGDRLVGDGHPAFIIAEAGINHNGRMEIARKLIDLAVEAGADAVKFQMRDYVELFRPGVVEDMSEEDIGFQYVMHLIKDFELTPEQYHELARYTASRGLLFLCTPWDKRSVDILEEIGVPAYKIASADLPNLDLLECVAGKKKPLLVSTGMSTMGEIETTVNFLRTLGAEFALLHCNSSYPTAFKDVNLRSIQTLRERFQCVVGYSGHELGIAVSEASVVVGASIVERHFTLDRTMKGPDHAMSLEPTGIKKLVRDVRHIEAAMGTGVRVMSRGEYMNRKVLGKSVISTRPIAAGETITADMLTVKSPAYGLSPQRMRDLVGKVAHRAVAAGGYLFESDLEGGARASRHFDSPHRWGLIVRYHDFAKIVGAARPRTMEFHLSSHDLALTPELPTIRNTELVVHAPELYGDRLLDLCAREEAERRRSVADAQTAIDRARWLKRCFPDPAGPVTVVLHVGGMSYGVRGDEVDKDAMYERLADSLRRLEQTDVELLLENLPPIPWYKGGQWWSNVFTDGDRIRRFCEREGYGVCYDTSHAQLFCNFVGESQVSYLDALTPFIRHLHVSDGSGLDGEGLQIGDGDVDFATLAPLLLATGATYTPEIWMGHKEDGEGFWVALHRLRKFGF
ncbi:MAG: N-acetylneuraminate synthase family protein [Candidatus Rokubacteria bacterium]|nr:N-acetylneuraminate synthase family protein [Candidatus Rokubacteria bacterium]